MTSSSSRTKKRHREATLNEDDQVKIWGRSMMDLPSPILTIILLKLPVKEILFCKSVCKTFNNLISNTASAKLHVSHAKTHTLIRAIDYPHVSRTLYLVELPDIDRQLPKTSEYHCEFKKINLDMKFKIPLRNSEMILNKVDTDQRKRCIKVKPKDHKLNLVNSCNGLICLSEPSVNDPVIVCNPVTGEFINLPGLKTAKMDAKGTNVMDCGFGFDQMTNEFKVIRMYNTDVRPEERTLCPLTGEMGYYHRVTEILSLGSGSWKNIGYAPCSLHKLLFPTYLNGSLHWLLCIEYSPSKVVLAFFNFSTERYHPLPLLHNMTLFYEPHRDTFSLGTLQGYLCVCDSSSCESLNIWVMKEYGVRESWTQNYSISLLCLGIVSDGPYLPLGLYQPLHVLTNGALLLFHPRKNALIYHGHEDRLFVVEGFKSKFEAIVHTPSFTSLKDALKGKNLPVLNINPRCGQYKLFGETKSIYLEEDFCLSRDSSSDHGSCSSY